MSKPLSYYSWPIAIVAFFVILAIGNVTLYTLANDSHQGSVMLESNAYETGLKYQQTLDALDRFHRSGLRLDVRTEQVASQRVLAVEINDERGQPVQVRSMTARAAYAASQSYDRLLQLKSSDTVGTYRAVFDGRPGTYLLAVTIEGAGGESMRYETKLVAD